MTGIGMIFLIVLIAAGIWLFFRVRPARQQDPDPDTASEPREGEKDSWPQRVGGTVGGWLSPVIGDQQTVTPGQFKQWLETAASPDQSLSHYMPETVRNFSGWVDDLPEDELKLLCQQASMFYSNLNMNLGWLVDGELDSAPELRQTAEDMVVFYCLACWKSVEAEEDVEPFLAFRAWQNDAKGQREFGHRLYAELLERGLVAAPPPGLFLDSEEAREEFMVEAIRNLATEDRQALNPILKELVLPESTTSSLDLTDHPELADVGTQPLDLGSYDKLLGNA